jgi:hypothetical protein
MAHDCEIWIHEMGVTLRGLPFTTVGHEYEVDILKDRSKRQCAIKGAQMGLSEVNVLRTLHGCIHHKYPQGVLYLFPTRDDVTDFSKGRFQPLIEDNKHIGRHVKSTDAANIKRVGNSMLYFRGARANKKIGGVKASSTSLKTVPVDRIVYDERDEMTDEMVDLASERISHSRIQEEFFLSTPTIPDYGIDRQYHQESDQRVWMIKCSKCGKETCLELEFPNCLLEMPDGSAMRVCIHCHNEIHPRDGRWVALYPDKAKDMVGWWISQLNSVYVEPGKILRLFNNPPGGNVTEVYNSKLGMAHIAAENRLSPKDLYNCCDKYPMASSCDIQTAMGVDVGKELHVVIGYKPNKVTREIIKVCRVTDFNDVHDLAKRYNVRCAVFDLYPETRKVKEFRAAESFSVFGCQYQESQSTSANWNWKEGIVKVNRNEQCDASHNVVVESNLNLPRRNLEVNEYIKEMCNIAKVLEEDPETGSKTYRYRKLGADHYRHATNYFLLAAEKIGVAQTNNVQQSSRLILPRSIANAGRNRTTGY